MRLLDNRNFHVKVSCCERASRKGPPYEDAVPFARELVQRFPQQTLWGTDWPHPNVTPVPDDHLLVDLLQEIAPSESQRKTLLVDNPERFYGFKA
jgi:2-pyrone-4,6-dicarboxylate lactonase